MLALVPADPVMVGDFELLARLGAGGMGQLYLGRRPGAPAAAIKLIRPDLTHQPDFRVRFRREIAVAAQADSPYTARVIGADPDGDPPWLAVEYVPAPSLAEVVGTHGRLPVDAARVLMAGLCAGLTRVHALGLVHRDLKPGNVLVGTDGPRIIDFGVSRVLDSSTITQTGQLLGSPGFMSPEQALGTGPVGAPTDVFSLGALMAFAVTGTSPFGAGQTAAVVYRVVHEPPALDDVPGEIRDLIAACLVKDPADRPTAAEVLDRLGADGTPADWLPRPVVDDIDRRVAELAALDTPRRQGPDPTVLRPRPAPATPPAPARRRGRAMALAGTGVVAALAVTGIAGYGMRGGEPGPPQTPAAVTERALTVQPAAAARSASSSPSLPASPSAPPPAAASAPAPAAAILPDVAGPAPVAADDDPAPAPTRSAAPRRSPTGRATPPPVVGSLQRTPTGCIRITVRNPGPTGPDPQQMIEVNVSGATLRPTMAAEVVGAARQIWFACGSGNVTTLRPAAVTTNYCLTDLGGSTVGTRPCDGGAGQTWTHRWRGKDTQDRDHWVLISSASARVLEIGASGQLRTAAEKDFDHRQLFWYWQA
ncbi:hypothetical protein Q0Z83_024220 [Actinoplanes sichuanensis]|uniref:Protein kinase n=1 Tax=Actinoplanes sichuanensis TaxID=512349 RepID=A0ABW4A0B8_9ACTN|nr:serine/threonine-protein kinase [Actinoplanes sichuanensis]BEL04231.1 hypothetical protein Q0Z83_024220 [Actinoplanes sichuanensis]